MTKLRIELELETMEALLAWSRNEMRDPDMQARFFVEQGLSLRYRQSDLPIDDVRRVVHWLTSLPLIYPAPVGDAIHRINAHLNEYPRDQGT